MIVDAHFHIFPPMGGASGHPSARHHARYMQRGLALHHLPVRKTEDASVVQQQVLIDEPDYTLNGLSDRDFRSGGFGRLMWTADGVDYYKQYLPPLLTDLSASPEVGVAQMNHAGVSRAVIHNGHLYGKLNQYISKALKRYPDRFWGTASVDEWRAHHKSQVAALDHALDDLGLHALWFDTQNIALNGRSETVDHRLFQPFWEHVRDRKIPVFWNTPQPEPSRASYLSSMAALGRWLKRYPEIPCVYTNGFPFDYFRGPRGVRFPQELWDTLSAPNLMVEVTFPIVEGWKWDYPFKEFQPIIRQMYRRLGPEHMVWGSDMPNVERYCTYRQCREYMKYCSFIPPHHMDLIWGGNIARLFADGTAR